MAGAGIVIEDAELIRLSKKISRLADADMNLLAEAVGGEVENQVKTRISEEKAAPDGTPWDSWSPDYAETRHDNQSLLENDGDLLKDIAYRIVPSGVEVGTSLEYGATHQHGAKQGEFGTGNYKTRKGSFPIPWGDIPARPYLGVSADNHAELVVLLENWIDDLLGL